MIGNKHSTRWLANRNQGPSKTFLIIFGVHMNISFIVKMKILVALIEWSYVPAQLWWLVHLEWLWYCERVVQSLSNHIPLKHSSPTLKKSNWISRFSTLGEFHTWEFPSTYVNHLIRRSWIVALAIGQLATPCSQVLKYIPRVVAHYHNLNTCKASSVC